jgi:hypothetical protein
MRSTSAATAQFAHWHEELAAKTGLEERQAALLDMLKIIREMETITDEAQPRVNGLQEQVQKPPEKKTDV